MLRLLQGLLLGDFGGVAVNDVLYDIADVINIDSRPASMEKTSMSSLIDSMFKRFVGLLVGCIWNGSCP